MVDAHRLALLRALIIPTTGASSIYSGSSTVLQNVSPTPVIIKWTLDADITEDDVAHYFSTLATLANMNGTNSYGPFEWWGEADSVNADEPRGDNAIQYRGPGNVGLSRFEYPGNLKTAMEFANLHFTSELEDASTGPSCGDIEGPLASVLGLIPEIGPFFGILGSVICSEVTDSGA